jgi:chromosome segregation ATPase
MSSDIKDLLTDLRRVGFFKAADAIEALEGERDKLKWSMEKYEDRAEAAEARAERLRVALEDAIETMELAERIPFIDPDYGQQIEALGRRIGFGALMTSASASWAKVNAEMGLPAGGHFVAAPCHASVVQSLNKMRKALEDDK